jgi:hypothetical protein
MEIAVAERVTRWHPVVATLRKEKWLSSIDKSLRERAFRLLHALAREAEIAATPFGSRSGTMAVHR